MSEKTILRFKDIEKVEDLPNEIFSLVFTTIIANFDAPTILIESGSSGNIMGMYI